jgi:hypothetical protein
VTKLWRILIAAIATIAVGATVPTARVEATAPPTTTATTIDAPPATNDLIPDNNDVTNCIGTVEQANCGGKARADGHTYLVFGVLAAGMAFIGWRIARGIRARDAANPATR